MKFSSGLIPAHAGTSPPTRGAWVEILFSPSSGSFPPVAPHTGGVG